MKYAELIEHIVTNIVAEPEAVQVKLVNEREGSVYYVTVAPNDVGKMIGKNGRVISALRQFVSASAAKGRRKAYVKVITD